MGAHGRSGHRRRGGRPEPVTPRWWQRLRSAVVLAVLVVVVGTLVAVAIGVTIVVLVVALQRLLA